MRIAQVEMRACISVEFILCGSYFRNALAVLNCVSPDYIYRGGSDVKNEQIKVLEMNG